MTPKESNMTINEHNACAQVPEQEHPAAMVPEAIPASGKPDHTLVINEAGEPRRQKPRLTVIDEGSAATGKADIHSDEDPDLGPDLLFTGMTESSASVSAAAVAPEPVIPLLELPAPAADYQNDISVFGFSQQGRSHIEKNIPCQDRCGFRFIGGSLLIAAIADGVGSCALSDYGSAEAVRACLDFLEIELKQAMQDPTFTLSGASMGVILRKAMRYTYDQVERKAEDMEQLLYSFQSTLTCCVYDGLTLFYAHVGDDGIVVVKKDGQFGMITTRHKGDEASSVYPLQARQWEPGRTFSNTVYGMCENVVSFLMVTDGVLDSFVLSEVEKCCVFYPFMRAFVSHKLENIEQTSELCQNFYERLASENYRRSVTDDITVICVVNQAVAHASVPPSFDQAEWDRSRQEAASRRRAALYPAKTQVPAPANHSELKQNPPSPSTGSKESAPSKPLSTPAVPIQPTPANTTVPTYQYSPTQQPTSQKHSDMQPPQPILNSFSPEYQWQMVAEAAGKFWGDMSIVRRDLRSFGDNVNDLLAAGFITLGHSMMNDRNKKQVTYMKDADSKQSHTVSDDPNKRRQ